MNVAIVEPREHEVQEFAYSVYQRRGENRHGFDRADWFMARRALVFHKNYERVVLYPFSADNKQFLGVKEGQMCRYCGRAEPEVTFKKVAHAIPHLLGNRSVFAHYECDKCNEQFSMSLEDHLGKILLPVRAILGMRGKKGVPSFKTDSQKSRIDYKDGKMTVAEVIDDRITRIVTENNRVLFTPDTQKFVPLAVYKCLLKIGLSVMPVNEIKHFPEGLAWVRAKDHHIGANQFIGAVCMFQLIPGPLPDDHGWVELFRRRDDRIGVPYMTLVVVSKNLVFQIPMHFCEKDLQHEGKSVQLLRFPAGLGLGYDYGETQFSCLDLSSPDERRVEVSIEMRSEAMVRSGGIGDMHMYVPNN